MSRLAPIKRNWRFFALNIIFDLGGVVIKWRPEAIIAKVFADPLSQALVRAEILEHADWLALDRGTLPQPDAIARASMRTGLSETEVACFFRQVPLSLVPIPATVDLLYRVKAHGHTLFCLSNIQFSFIEHLEAVYSFWEVFTGAVISCRLNLLKPEPAIYAYLLQKYGLDASKTVFVDDMDENLVAAARFGLQTVRFENPTQCAGQLRRLGCF